MLQAGFEELKHIPGDNGMPFIGNTLPLVFDTINYGRKMKDKYGLIYRSYAFGRHNVTFVGAEANEYVLMDRDKNFSSKLGWDIFLGKLFPRGLMLLDFDEHRLHRKAMAGAFKTGPMQSYLKQLDKTVQIRLKEWKSQEKIAFYPSIKQLTLDLAAGSFWGDDPGGRMEEVKTAFIDMVAAAVSPIRTPLPFTQMKKGIEGRRKIVEIFSAEVPKRRTGTGEDIFTEMCKATTDDGVLLSNDAIVDHMSFLLMAAHDTLTSSISSLIYHLAKHPEWQDKLREEVRTLHLTADFAYEKLNDMPLTEMAFKEAMRLYPPVPGIQRQSLREFTFGGFTFPAGTLFNINPMACHRLENLWPNPDDFDPSRFTPEAIRERHKYAWIPFSGGAHMCLGLHFAYMQVKSIIGRLLIDTQISLEEGYDAKWQILPIPKPSKGLPVILKPIK